MGDFVPGEDDLVHGTQTAADHVSEGMVFFIEGED